MCRYPISLLRLSIFFFLSGFPAAANTDGVSLVGGAARGSRLRTYIVHVQPPPPHLRGDLKGREAYHRSFLPVHLVDSGEQRLLYSYEHAISGFAARLSDEDLAAVESKDGFLVAYPDELIPLQTTHTPEFLGLRSSGVWNESNFGDGVIIGVLDKGINPDHPSFACDLPPPPSSWRGQCEFGPGRCNKKIIGARGFVLGLREMVQSGEVSAEALGDDGSLGASPDDVEGHGTHVAGTAAGCFVDGASSYGQARGTAAGVAPRAYLSVYKICGKYGCAESDILAGLDAAINDGVHIASLSLGMYAKPFYSEQTAIAGFRAAAKGIFVSTAGGNFGPDDATLANEAPWLLTVAASSMDRSIRATVRLGNGLEFDGESLDQTKPLAPTQLPLVYGGSCVGFYVSVQGKVVLCDNGRFPGAARQDRNVINAGGAAVILANADYQGSTTLADPHSLPASHVSSSAGSEIMKYISSTSKPTAAIVFKGTLTGGAFTPAVPYFSSRGPSRNSPGILKPDIAGPGVNILAAWPNSVGPPDASSLFLVMSGTSMATPHLSGAAALVKAVHPTWSPAAIKSALMTSAVQTGSSGKPIEDHMGNSAFPYDIGAGQVNVRAAIDTTVVYDISTDEYTAYLCGLHYTDSQVSSIVGRAVSCAAAGSIKDDELNYPTIATTLNAAGGFTRRLTRTLTNLGASETTCTWLSSTGFGSVSASVQPTTLRISAGEKKQYTATFAWSGPQKGLIEKGYIRWSCNGKILTSVALVTF